jgi:hypothetical protein
MAVSLFLGVAGTAKATVIAPQGSLTIDLENFSNGEPYFVYSNVGGSAPVYNSSTNSYSGGTAGQMTSGATVTIQGQRYVFQTDTLYGVNNLPFHVGDLQTLVTSGVYPDGNYNTSTNLTIMIDGLTFVFTSVSAQYSTFGQNGAGQYDEFYGVMEAGTSTNTGVSYSAGIADLELALTQSNVSGGASIGYEVDLSVLPAPEPATASILGAGLVPLGLIWRRRKALQVALRRSMS